MANTTLAPRLLHLALRARTLTLTPPTTQHNHHIRRTLTTTPPNHTAWSKGPSPPRLPKSEQEIFEQLQRNSTGAFSTPRSTPHVNQINQSPDSHIPEVDTAQITSTTTSTNAQATSTEGAEAEAVSGKFAKGEELHPHIRRGAKPEFEGEVNPKTGEAGGPKNEPLRWGGGGDWSYNGRATDF